MGGGECGVHPCWSSNGKGVSYGWRCFPQSVIKSPESSRKCVQSGQLDFVWCFKCAPWCVGDRKTVPDEDRIIFVSTTLSPRIYSGYKYFPISNAGKQCSCDKTAHVLIPPPPRQGAKALGRLMDKQRRVLFSSRRIVLWVWKWLICPKNSAVWSSNLWGEGRGETAFNFHFAKGNLSGLETVEFSSSAVVSLLVAHDSMDCHSTELPSVFSIWRHRSWHRVVKYEQQNVVKTYAIYMYTCLPW